MKKYSATFKQFLLCTAAVLVIWSGIQLSTGFAGNEPETKTAKYIFYFIGDGMGAAQVNSAQVYLDAAGNKTGKWAQLSFTDFPVVGLKRTYSANSYITDSAAAGTAMATGEKTNQGTLGLDSSGKPLVSIAELAKGQGMKVGIVSTASIDHATPAAFYAHQNARGSYYEIGKDLTESNFDYFGGGGFLQPRGKDGKQPDLFKLAESKGYKIVKDKAGIEALKAGAGKTIAISPVLDASQSVPFEIDQKQNALSLADFTRKGIEVLNQPKGFFLMVEGGKIDWACHENDGGTVVKETIGLSEAVAEAYKFYEKHPDETLIIVTGDHETGGMSLGSAKLQYQLKLELLAKQTMSSEVFEAKLNAYKQKSGTKAKLTELMPLIAEAYGLKAPFNTAEQKQLEAAFKMSMTEKSKRPKDDETYRLYGNIDPLASVLNHMLAARAGIGFTTYSHTGVTIPVYAVGVGAEAFSGSYEDTEVFHRLKALLE